MQISKTVQDCIESCKNCHDECKEALFRVCLEKGGDHTAPEHVRIMVDCIQICQVAADAMIRGSEMQNEICRICADICDMCAESCEDLDSDEMKDCAQTCRDCAQICRNMSGSARSGKTSGAREGATLA